MSVSDQPKPAKLEKVSACKVVSPLLGHSRNVTSQSGEDGIIEKIIDTLNIERKFCVEFGAWDGKHFSNCYNLTTSRGWSGLMIEANPKRFMELQELYKKRADVETINKYVNFEGEDCLDSIFSKHFVPEDLGLLSIDIDGNDYHIWQSLKDYAPEIVVVEFNPTVPNDVVFVQARSHDVNQGCSLLALIGLGKEKGYELVCCTDYNAIFVKENRFAELGVEDNRIDRLFQYWIDGRIFHGYDSTVYVVGMPKLLWTNKTLSHEDFQILPASQRVFSGAADL